MREYLLSVHGDSSQEMPEDFDPTPMFEAVDRFNQKLQDAGVWVFAGGLHPVSTATVVDGTGVETVITDGPYLEAKEHLGGFWIIKVEDLDAAIDWARQGSAACQGAVEVRPFQDEADDAAMKADAAGG